MVSSSTRIGHEDVRYIAGQKVKFADKEIYSDGENLIIDDTSWDDVTAVSDDLTTTSGSLQDQIDDINVALIFYVPEANNQTLASGVDTVYVTFSGTQDDTDYRISTVMKNTMDDPALFLNYYVKETTVSGFTMKLSATTDSINYSIDWSIIRTT